MTFTKKNSYKITLSIFQFFNVGLFSFYVAFLPIYLAKIGLSAQQIAILGFISTFVMMISAPLVLELITYKFSPSRITKVISIISLITFFLFLTTNNFILITIIWSLFIGSRISASTLVDIDILGKVPNKNSHIKFENIRLWGSIGFILIGILLGILFKAWGAEAATRATFILIIIQSYLTFGVSRLLSISETEKVKANEIFKILKSKKVFLLYTVVGLTWVSHAPLYTYLSLYLEALGFSPSLISLCWNLGVIGEIIFFLLFWKFEKYFSLEFILKISILVSIIRWLILATASNSTLIIFSQFLHSFTFGGVYLCGIKLSYSYFPERIKNKSQGYLSLLGIGLGSLIGRIILSLTSSNLSDYSTINVYFYYAAVISLLAFIISFFIKKEVPSS